MPTAFLVLWAVATVALAVYLVVDERRDEAKRRERHRASGDVRPFAELSVLERIIAPIALALLISAVVGGLAGAFYKVFTV